MQVGSIDMMEAHQLIKNIIPAPDSIKLTNEEIFKAIDLFW